MYLTRPSSGWPPAEVFEAALHEIERVGDSLAAAIARRALDPRDHDELMRDLEEAHREREESWAAEAKGDAQREDRS